MDNETVGSILRSARKNKIMTLRHVEESTGFSNAYLSQLENDKIKRPSANTLYALAEFYKIDFDSLMVAAGFVDRKSPGNTAKYVYIKVDTEFEGEMLRYLDFLKHQLVMKRDSVNLIFKK